MFDLKRDYISLVFLVLAMFMCTECVVAQPANINLNHDISSFYERQLYFGDSAVHTSVRPLNGNEFIPEFKEESKLDYIPSFFYENWKLRGDQKGLQVQMYPIINILPGFELVQSSGLNADSEFRYFLGNGLGFNVGHGRKWHAQFNYMYSDARYFDHMQRSIGANNAVPGFGDVNRAGNSFFNHYADGYISYSPNKVFNFQAGVGRNFFGEGYRSMLLSDYAINYPYAKISTNIWKIKYVNLFAMQLDASADPFTWTNAERKYSSSHYLSMNIGKRWNVGIFESVIWRAKDSTYNREFDVNYLNPVIFFRPVEFSVGSPDNVLVGLNTSYKVGKKHLIYGQLMIDEFLLREIREGNGWWANKYAFQLGWKSFFKTINAQIELNQARPYTYSHSSVSQNYGHYNQPLAHPLGANFREFVGRLSWQKNRLRYEGMMIFAQLGKSFAGENVGQNIFVSNSTRESEFGNALLQGNRNDILLMRLSGSYLLNFETGLSLTAGVQYRQESIGSLNNVGLFLGVKTGIFNRYTEY